MPNIWHGNPIKFEREKINPRTKTTFGELYDATLRKIETIQNAGYHLVYVWGD